MMLRVLPYAISFSQIEAHGEDDEEPVEFGAEDKALAQVCQDDDFLFLLKTLPKDRYKVIALLLYIRDEMGFSYTYQDIAKLWGCSKVNIFNHVKRMRSILAKATKAK